MKKFAKIIAFATLFVLTICCLLAFSACDAGHIDGTLRARFTAPEGTPALAILRLPADNKTLAGYEVEYEIVSPSNIAAEMSAGKSDFVIMPVNAGANLIRQGAEYKLVSIAVDGSLFMVGRKEGDGTIEISDIIGKKVACIGKTGVPGLIFRYVMAKNNVRLIEEGTPNAENNEVLVTYVADGTAAKTLLSNRESGVDFAVVGEPAATTFLNAAPLALNASLNMQTAYEAVSGEATYPQAGLFVKKPLTDNEKLMGELFSALKASKEWVLTNQASVTEFAKENLYESAAFPAPSIAKCAINGTKIDETGKNQVISFLKNVAPKDGNGNEIDWDAQKTKLFIE